jgi:hypothetical protein
MARKSVNVIQVGTTYYKIKSTTAIKAQHSALLYLLTTYKPSDHLKPWLSIIWGQCAVFSELKGLKPVALRTLISELAANEEIAKKWVNQICPTDDHKFGAYQALKWIMGIPL